MKLIAAALVTAVTVLLGGCATAVQPVSAVERAHIRTLLMNDQWAPLAIQYPEAIRPVVPVMHTVADHDWALDVVSCLRARGYIAQVTGDGFSYDAYTGETALEFSVEGYICTANFAKQSDVFARLSADQQAAFDSFELTQVQPCLRLAGATTTSAPAVHLTGLAGWSPYDEVWKHSSAREIRYLEQRCPPIPSWMNLDN